MYKRQPVYESTHTLERTDFRKTLYWNPVIQTDEQGEAEFKFFTSDEVSSFIITAEGMTARGQLGHQEKLFSTSKKLNIDFKAPKFLTLDDTTLLNVVLTNNLKAAEKVNLKIELGPGFETVSSDLKPITIPSKSFEQVEIPIIAKHKTKNSFIKISAKNVQLYDAVKQSIDLISPYFPSSFTLSKNEASEAKFRIPALVDGSLSASLNVYTNSLSTTMDGVEGLLGAPHGCFEQTSSYTYPNVLVLDLLRTSGMANPTIEKKALHYIKLGYDRLMSFESPNGGFEWWGGDPASETLSAYGLLEFTDMKKVYPAVSQEMINRTTKWLLSRKDGKGGFKQGRFFSACNKEIANAYIVYAISAAQLNVDIELEYLHAYNDAVESQDVYRLALLALSSHYLNKLEKRDKLNTTIAKLIKKNGFANTKIKGSMTGSYYNSKQIEATSLIVLARLKAEQIDEVLMKGMDYILANKRGHRFGSTQATCLALQAILEYAKMENGNTFASTDSVHVQINGKEFVRPIASAQNGKIEFNGLEEYIKEGVQDFAITFKDPKIKIPYAFNADWQTFKPNSQKECALELSTRLKKEKAKVSETTRMEIRLRNKLNEVLASPIAIIGIPSGTSVQPWQLKELVENEAIAFYELHDNELVIYWRSIEASSTKAINLDLKAELAGSYQASASRAYLYYGDEYKHWVGGENIEIKM